MQEPQPKRRFVVTEVMGSSTTNSGNHFITCRLDGESGTLAIWGKVGGDMRHVEEFRARAKTPCPITVEAAWIEPTDPFWVDEHGHQYWVYERFPFRILS
jgi:hypothetical protein